jgi:hypothetical protein
LLISDFYLYFLKVIFLLYLKKTFLQMRVWRLNDPVYSEDKYCESEFGKIVFQSVNVGLNYYFNLNNTTLYIQKRTMIIEEDDIKKLVKYVENPNTEIPYCTRIQLLYWLYYALGNDKKFKENEEKLEKHCRRKRRPVFFYWCCCFSIFFILIFAGGLAGLIYGVVQQDSTTSFSFTTTSTSAVTTTTTASPTTSPFNFSLVCGSPNYVGDLELTSIFNVTITGEGCDGSPVNVTTSYGPINFSKKRKRSEPSIINTVEKHAVKITGRLEQRLDQPTGITYTSKKKRDINVFPDAKQDFEEFYFIDCEDITPSSTDREIYIAADNNDETVVVCKNNCQRYYIFNATTEIEIATIDVLSMFPPSCTIDSFVPHQVKYDHEADRYVFALLSNNTFCITITNTSDPLASRYTYRFYNDTQFNFSQAFEFAVWGNYYTSCWINSDGQQCVIVDRLAILAGSEFPNLWIPAEPLFYLPNPFVLNIPAVTPLTQGLSTRGSLVSCGAFAIANDQTQTLEFLICTNVTEDNVVIFQSYNISVLGGGWTSGNNLPCNIGGVECIQVINSLNRTAFSNRLRVAYYNYGTYEKLGYIFLDGLGSLPFTRLLWGEMTNNDLLSQTPVIPGNISDVTSNCFAPGIYYDCRETLFLTFTKLNNPTGSNDYWFSYHLQTDPENEMRIPTILNADDPFFEPFTIFGMPVAMPNTQLPRTGRFGFFTDLGTYGYFNRLQDQEFDVTYIATDTCGNSVNCTQTVHLGTVTPCQY